MKANTGYTYVELLIGLLVSSFVMLTIGAVWGLGKRSYDAVQNEMAIYSDVSYGFKLIQNRVRQAKSIKKESAAGNWVDEKLLVNDLIVFGLYRPSGSATTDFVCVKDKANETSREVLFSVPVNKPLDLTVTISGSSVSVSLQGEKQNIPFTLQTTVLRRI